MLKKTLLIAAFACGTAHAGMFDGFTNGCETDSELFKATSALCKPAKSKGGFTGCAKGKLNMPAELSDGSFSLKNNGDHTLFTVPLKSGAAQWGGNEIAAIENWQGHENGIHGYALVLKAKSEKEVRDTLKQNKVKLKTQKNDVLGDMQVVINKGQDGKVRAICDLSD